MTLILYVKQPDLIGSFICVTNLSGRAIILAPLKDIPSMCYHPIKIINPSKYVSLKYRDRFVIEVPCGHCAQCLQSKSDEWSYRLYHHAQSTMKTGFVLFDTLTYDNAHLPHISDYIPVSKEVDFPCFSAKDLRLFVADLRQRCKRQFKSNFSYFIASEYGTSENHLHRPHYHALFFVNGEISPLEFSALVATTWQRGRTDGLPFQNGKHVMDNVFREMSDHALRSLKYICKYIQKDCKFQKTIDSRLDYIMSDICRRFEEQGLDDWSKSSHYWRVREAIARKINQFHRQSTYLGADVLGELDINELFKTGSLYMPDNDFVIKKIPLPTYFKRKLFYEIVEIDGAKSWQPTELGRQYLEFREKFQLRDLADRLKALSVQLQLNFNSLHIADYIQNVRGRFIADKPSSTIEDRLNNISLFNYVSRYDREQFGRVGLSPIFLGNSSSGYVSRRETPFVNIQSFISENVYFNRDYEVILDKIHKHVCELGVLRQNAYQAKQRLSNLVHHFFM